MSEIAAEPSVRFTEAAAEKLSEIIENHANPVAGLRLQISTRREGQIFHLLSLVEDGAQKEADVPVEASGIRVYLEPRDASYLDGVEIDFYSDEEGNQGLRFNNPNPVWRDPRELELQSLFDELINPQIGGHGGTVNLIGVQGRKAYVEFGGGCVGCGMLNTTLKNGVESVVIGRVADIDEIVDITDHASGTNPYYRAPEGGHGHAHGQA